MVKGTKLPQPPPPPPPPYHTSVFVNGSQTKVGKKNVEESIFTGRYWSAYNCCGFLELAR